MPHNLTAGFRCVVYDAAVLAMALRKLRRPTDPANDLGRKTDQLAVEAAQIKYRSLCDFITAKGRDQDDIKLSEFGTHEPLPLTPDRKRFRVTVNKYSAHLTWQRTRRDPSVAEFPRPRLVLKYGILLLHDVSKFIEQQIVDGQSTDVYGKRYLAKLRECMKELEKKT